LAGQGRGSAGRVSARVALVAAALAALAMITATLLSGISSAAEAPAAAPAAASTTARAASTPTPSAPTPSDGASGRATASPHASAGRAPAAAPAAVPLRSASAPAAPPPAPAPSPAPSDPAPASGALVAGTPCTATARACVDLAARRAWLIDGGAVTRGPVPVMTGDRDDPTPRGTFAVQWKAQEYTSREYLTQMPYSVFFADGGVAFHEGRQDTYSAGCVKLVHDDAVAWFNYLQVGDQVQVH
jgi:lipoprotein-anchoring transpeptidase ErfK/SrfK